VLQNFKKSKYLVSQLLASVFKEFGWDGLYVPGVHGRQGDHYHNLTLIGQVVDKWEDWTVGKYFQKK